MKNASTLSFRSNIYPTTTRGLLVNDRVFLSKITDSEALEQMWRFHGSRGALLTAHQRRLHEARIRCAYAEHGDFPWGTPVGGNAASCLCEKTSCPNFQRCVDASSRSVVSRARARYEEAGLTGGESPDDRADLDSYSHRRSTAIAENSDCDDGWTPHEKEILISRYQECMKDTTALKALFPNHTLVQIDYQARRLGIVEKTPYRRRKSLPPTPSKTPSAVPHTNSQKPHVSHATQSVARTMPNQKKTTRQQAAAIKKSQQDDKQWAGTKRKMNDRPWQHDEDVIIRRTILVMVPT